MGALKENKNTRQVLPDIYKRVLRQIPTNSDRLATTTEIAKATNLRPVHVRYYISRLITEYNVPIATSNRQGNSGYHIITNEMELHDTVRNLKGRADKITKRYEALQNIDLNTWQDQVDYEL
ncbi:hypothetical protein [Piscibacillus halophilus]|uniref:hypothetical protein n=1 Tax=Piscibacillus halophilus TaxID=571933 RepID=UPI00158BC43E|nr:hypothetical protein [Piscibacillus halophilus]